MKKLSALMLLCSALLSNAWAQSAEEAVAMVDKGAAYIKKNGLDALVKEVNAKSPEFSRGELYLVVRASDGTVLAHGTNQKLVGKNLVNVGDADGKMFRKEILELAKTKGKGWVDYRYNNPTTNNIESKTTYILKVGDVTLESGIYKK